MKGVKRKGVKRKGVKRKKILQNLRSKKGQTNFPKACGQARGSQFVVVADAIIHKNRISRNIRCKFDHCNGFCNGVHSKVNISHKYW